MNVLNELRKRVGRAIAQEGLGQLGAPPEGGAELVQPSQDTRFGDYQANCAMPIAKALGKPPRDIAARVVAALDVEGVCDSVEIAGPGFINLRLGDRWIEGEIARLAADVAELGVPPTGSPRTYVVDYSSPNVAKPMHVGHIRSTVIGAALVRVLRRLGHHVISDNHIGDWGTQFGMILYGVKHLARAEALAQRPVEELGRLYKLVSQASSYQEAKERGLPEAQQAYDRQRAKVDTLASRTMPLDPADQAKENRLLREAEAELARREEELDGLRRSVASFEAKPGHLDLATEHPQLGAKALEETAKLHAGDPQNLALWKQYLPACLQELDLTYERLGVTFDHTLGESFYHDALGGVVAALQQAGIAKESEGALAVFLEGHEAPFLVRKRDGAYLYATTDLATIQYRVANWKPDAILYVVDHRQSLHFEQLFATARKWGYDSVELTHVAFGTVLGEDGKPYKTRSGSAVGLMGLLDEAVERALAIARQSPAIETDPERQTAAERIGIGAIKYADLAHNRTSDYVFSYDKMLAMQGNTAAYMQYSYARVRSIFTKGDVDPQTLRTGDLAVEIKHPTERALALALLRFPEALERVASDYRPNHLTGYLFELASRYSEFFENCPVLKAEDPAARTSRLVLCDLTARTIERGLHLLGIEVVERM